MKKMICLLLSCLLLCGCTQEAPPATEPTQEPTQAVLELPLTEPPASLKYAGISLTYRTLLTQQDAEAQVLRQAAADFEQTTGAQITLCWADAESDVLSADIFEVAGAQLQGQLLLSALDLTELAEQSGYESRSWSVLRSQILDRCGSLKAIACRPVLYGMYYNRQVFEDLQVEASPSTWQEYLDFCAMLKEKGYEGLVIDQERAHLILELHMERALGWETLKDTMLHARWRSNTMAMTMIQEAIRFAEQGYLVKGNPASYPLGQNRLSQSNAVFAAGSNLLCREVEEATLAQVRWGVMAYPGDGPGSGLLVDSDVVAVNSACPDPQAAFDFIMLLTGGEYDQLRADLTLSIPADPNNFSPITGANACMTVATAQAPKWFTADNNELFSRLWNGWYKTGAYFADQLNRLAVNFESEKSVG